MRRALTLNSLLMLCLALAAPGCAGDSSSPGGAGGKADDPGSGTGPCAGLLEDDSGQHLDGATIEGLSDPIASLIFRGAAASCPLTFHDLSDALRAADSKGCEDGGRAGLKAHVVSERSQATFSPDSYRVVVTRTCDGRPDHGLFMNIFGVRPSAPGATSFDSLPDDVEVIAFDAQAGQFHYYSLEDLGKGRRWHFFGSSSDLLAGPGVGTFPAQERRCANCHVGGGLVMKELHVPWVHWEPVLSTPGAKELADAFEDLGEHSIAPDLEPRVEQGNRVWNQTRVERLRDTGTVADLLEPLFCTVELNISSVTPGNFGTFIQIKPSWVDPFFSGAATVNMNANIYGDVIEAAHQRVVDRSGHTLQRDGHDLTDLSAAYTTIERSDIDGDYVQALIKAGIIDQDFAADVLSIDFTRPVFSDQRCGLLGMSPELDPAERDPAHIRDGFVAQLEAAAPADGTPAAQLLAALGDTGDTQAHRDAVQAFADACQTRSRSDAMGLMTDLDKIASLLRDEARERPVLEFAESLPVDDLDVDPATRLSPADCTLETAP